jgi:drug/metabolite transporter (DMT)-like permease
MFHTVVKLYLYALIFFSLAFVMLYSFLWLKRGRLSRPKSLLREFLFLLVGLVCLSLFNSRVLGDNATLIVASLFLLACVYAVEAVEKIRSQTKHG